MSELQESEKTYRVMLPKDSLKEWGKLDHSVKRLFEKKLQSVVRSPVIPKNKLHGELSACYKIKLNRAGYRLVYEVRHETIVLIVWAIDRRDKSKAYESASKRLREIALEECTEIVV